MSGFEQGVQVVTAIVSVATLVWSIIDCCITRKQDKKLAEIQSKLEKGIHVSKAVFDKLFTDFQMLSEYLFDAYNVVEIRLFPFVEEEMCFLSNEEKLKKMQEYYNDAAQKINALVRLIKVNKFILPETLFENLSQFERVIKSISQKYENKTRDVILGCSRGHGSFSEKMEVECNNEKAELARLYKQIEEEMKNFLNNLQVEI